MFLGVDCAVVPLGFILITGETDRCILDGRKYDVGETWNPTLQPLGTMPCVNCTCLQGGKVECKSEKCPRPDCPEPEHPPGQCCPICIDYANLPPTDQVEEDNKNKEPQPGCKFDGEEYEDGEVFPSNKTGLRSTRDEQCVMCVCSKGHLLCHLKTCLPVKCKTLITTSDDCCPRCGEMYFQDELDYEDYLDSVLSDPIPKNVSKADCLAMGYKENSSSWHPVVGAFGEMKCITCRCLNGKVDCARETCLRDDQLPCKKPRLVPGDCCKTCNKRQKHRNKNRRKTKKRKNRKKKDKSKKKKRRKKQPTSSVGEITTGMRNKTKVYPCLAKKSDRFVYFEEKGDSMILAFNSPKDYKVEINTWTVKKGRLSEVVNTFMSRKDFLNKYSYLTVLGSTNKRRYKKLKKKLNKTLSRCKTKCRKRVVIKIVNKLKTKKDTYSGKCGDGGS
ncbi:hypothetical protein SNE40_021309 [Patella caerulea]|uniref:VWFC domain-containing protein n=1 Tax=Patella caerulea TaxID=87958 RepID=A0AAN8IYZ0_PATCE